jgi:hypothetical protein
MTARQEKHAYARAAGQPFLTTSRGVFVGFSAAHDHMMVNQQNELIAPINQPGALKAVDPAMRKAAKAIYQMILSFEPKKDREISYSVCYGTAFHIGNGYFMTNAHNLQEPQSMESSYPVNPRTASYKITLTSGSCDLTQK